MSQLHIIPMKYELKLNTKYAKQITDKFKHLKGVIDRRILR